MFSNDVSPTGDDAVALALKKKKKKTGWLCVWMIVGVDGCGCVCVHG